MNQNELQIIFGLGNPGREYEKNRHNAGFIVVDEIQKELGFPDFEFNKKFNAEISEQKTSPSLLSMLGFQKGPKIILAKPQTYMNRSGESVRKTLDFYKAKPENILVIYDELDIIVGKYKISDSSSASGHNGLQSIATALGGRSFKRIKVGIEQGGGRQNRKTPGYKFVLQDFTEEELKEIQKVSREIIDKLFECCVKK